MSDISNFENKGFFILRKFTEIVEATFFWMLFCLPVVTIGASSSAYYAAMHGAIRRDRETVWSNFWRVFKTYFRKATIVWLWLFLLLALAVLGFLFTYGGMKQGSPIGGWTPMFFIPMVFILAISIYVFPYVVRFQVPAMKALKNAATLAVLKLHWTLVMLALIVPAILSLTLNPVAIFIAPGVLCLLYELILEKIFRSIMRPEDLQKELEREKKEREDRVER